MTPNLKKTVVPIVILALTTLLTGCGEKGETNAPAVALTASTVASTTVSAHAHSVTIPFGDVSPAPGNVIQYRSDTVNGHSHVIAFSIQQMIDLNNGMQVSLVSSDPSSGAAHTHIWSIQGGSVLYEKNCFNCHSNDKRNHSPMNVSFNGSQTAAVINPGSAPLSTSAAATPDPNYIPATSVNAASVYAGLCAGCHSLGTVDTLAGSGPNLSGKGGLVNGKYPTPGVVSHHGLSLTAAEITAMISYLNAN